MSKTRAERTTLLAVASGGGHWEELMLLRPALEPFGAIFATTNAELALRDGLESVQPLPDSNRNQPLKALNCLWHCWRLVRAVRPQFVVTTGALPGLFCLIVARLHGASTIWIDSVANSDKPSMSGYCARPFATMWLTQWQHLSGPSGLQYEGALL